MTRHQAEINSVETVRMGMPMRVEDLMEIRLM
jgi:hypothetical protein